MSQQGYQAKLLFCVMRENIRDFMIAEKLDPDYAKAVAHAKANGVEILCYVCDLSTTNIHLSHQIPIIT